MTVVARFLLTIAAVFLAVNPVMACCFSDSPHEAQLHEATSPPCHGQAASALEDANSADADNDLKLATYPGCIDCNTAVFATSLVPDGSSLETSSRSDFFVVRADTYAPPKAFVDRLSTGPPSAQVTTAETPFKLKQQLLI